MKGLSAALKPLHTDMMEIMGGFLHISIMGIQKAKFIRVTFRLQEQYN
jgi:hypothetical protein